MGSNPYFIEPQQSPILNFTNQLMHLKLAKEDQLLRQRQIDETERVHGLEYGTGAPGTAGYMPGLKQQTLDVQNREVAAREMAAQTDRAKLGVLGTQFTPVMSARTRAKAKGLGIDKALQPELDALSAYGKDPQFTMEMAHDDFVSNWPQKKDDLLTRLEEEYAKKAVDPKYETTPEGMKLATLIERLNDDQDGTFISSVIFPGVAEAKGMIRGKVQSEITKNLREGYDTKMIYGPNGEVQQVSVPKGTSFNLPQGWSDKSPVTDDIREYNLAKQQGYKGTFEQWQVKMKKAGASNVNLNVGTKTALEKDIIEQQTAIDTLTEIEKQFRPEYLTYAGRGKQFVGKVGEKIGTQVVDENWLAARQNWYQITKSNQIAFRKWATGVAGGEKELNEIAKAYPDPDKNSPTEFAANLKQAKLNAIRLKKRYNMFLLNGVTPTKDKLSTVSLSEIKVDESELAGGISQEAQNYLKNLGK